ncbi:hypothetical protein AVEN_40897-1 [Araneus ventricosus]|uniref:Uncharacterized protein n=1 Tax=Araneus ventricosus TaxID=182803 RepID=A0A4Y2PP85_ARAVE|nr:hypothetical protein AVEN_40897-1 [Araneus ventricosus]
MTSASDAEKNWCVCLILSSYEESLAFKMVQSGKCQHSGETTESSVGAVCGEASPAGERRGNVPVLSGFGGSESHHRMDIVGRVSE